ncbi:hypothetical protein OS493_037935 [Desmophyllum pertusum]|uniref:ZP domain-containing protein n=1 Tax=Desmophyllum pertusum TaxID=174260 RepID=A0A9W9Y708_9CNID|nr:hypothetical protein OS493_037935 [Desmophyllum pertusum]
MKNLILLVTFALVCHHVKGQNPPDPVGTVTCHDDHTVDISISNVDDLAEWTTTEWRLEGNSACDPKFDDGTVTYTGLSLPDCSMSSKQLSGDIKYVLKVNAIKPDPVSSTADQLRGYDHLYYVSCEYDNEDIATASFVPIKNRNDNDSSSAFFTFTLDVFYSSDHTGKVPNPIALDTTLYFKAKVETQSDAPNLDLFPTSCWSSKSSSPASSSGKFTLITNGCGNWLVSEDVDDTLSYTCADDDVVETFSIQTYRYFQAVEGASVYFHCDLKVCLADIAQSACDCPDTVACRPFPPTRPPRSPVSRRRRGSVTDIVDETAVYHVTAGPYIFKKNDDVKNVDESDEGGSGKQDKRKTYFSTTMAIIVSVSGVVLVAIVSATVYLLMRNHRWFYGDMTEESPVIHV